MVANLLHLIPISSSSTGVNHFTDPNIGDFTVEFSKAGGKNGDTVDGLHNPIVKINNVAKGDPIDIESIIDSYPSGTSSGMLCYADSSNGALLRWGLAVPLPGRALFGLSNYNQSSTQAGFTPGWCTMHVVQYHRNEYGVGAQYDFAVVIFAAAKKQPGDAKTNALVVSSALPATIIVTPGADDAAPVNFQYNGQSWDSNAQDHQSTLGQGADNGYENGNRQGDMGFTC